MQCEEEDIINFLNKRGSTLLFSLLPEYLTSSAPVLEEETNIGALALTRGVGGPNRQTDKQTDKQTGADIELLCN